MAITYQNLYMDLRRQLRQQGVEAASLEAREILCFATGKTREELTRDGALYVAAEIEQKVAQLAERRRRGEPVAYLIGEWEFYGLPLDINPSVLIPRADTEVLVDKALPYIQRKGACRVLDLCAGSGCIGLAVAKHAPDCHVLLAELSEPALHLCRQNIRRNTLGGQVQCMSVDALQKPPQSIGSFDFLLCNPPYIAPREFAELDVSVREYEPRMALLGLDEDGLGYYRAILARWCSAMTPEGMLFFEVGFGQADQVLRMMRSSGFGNLEITDDPAGIHRVVSGTLCAEL